ncbi:MAG: hypothetical protein WCK73_05815 [Deltaproteobacteria bacterium]
MHEHRRHIFPALAALLGSLLSACGGTSDSTPSPPPVGTLEVACSGTSCGAASPTQYSGSGVGIWRYRNTGDSAASVDIDISGVSAGQQALLLFSNGSMRSASLPAVGTLASPARFAPAAPVTDPMGGIDRDERPRDAFHSELLRWNAEAAELLQRRDPASRGSAALGTPRPASSTPAVGSSKSWYQAATPAGTYTAVVKAVCNLTASPGRKAVFWVDPASTASGSIGDSDLVFFQNVFCGATGGFARVIEALGDVWGAGAAQYTNVIQDEPVLQDVNILFLEVKQNVWAGYFASANNLLKSSVPASNEALAFFIDSAQVRKSLPASEDYIGSTLLHELTHMVNFNQRNIVRGYDFRSDTWLEEMSAMMTEDIVVPSVTTNRYSSIPGQRVRGYIRSGGGASLLNWSFPAQDAYSVGGSLDGFLDRRYGTAIWKGQVDCPGGASWSCMDGLIRTAGGEGFADEFARLGATIFGLVPAATTPDGYGFPRKLAGEYTLDAIDPTTYTSYRPATATSLGVTFDPGTQTYLLDTIPSGGTRYQRNGVSVPAGTSIMLVVQ